MKRFLSQFAPVLLVLALALPLAAQTCSDQTFNPLNGSAWNGWGGNPSNTRFADSENGIRLDDLDELQLKWAFGFPEARSVIGQPSVFGGRVYIGVDTGEVYSLDAETGCTYWMFKADAGVRTAPVLAEIGDAWTVFVGDLGAQAYALDAVTGKLKWKVEVDPHPSARITGAPQFAQVNGQGARRDRLIVPVASGEEGAGANPDYACCTFRGSVVALDATTGDLIWKTYTIQTEPKSTGEHSFGPSGGAIWSAPTIDSIGQRIFVGTGDAYSAPADVGTDAVIAMDLATGAILWTKQETKDDIWVSSCMRPNAPEDCGPDHDFGSPPMLVTSLDGEQFLVAGQKSGNVWAHNPDTGEVLWRTPLVEDTTAFGGKIVWGGAADHSKAYFGLGPGGIGAVRLDDGERLWLNEIEPAAGMESHPGHEGPLTAVPGVVFSGGWDGMLRALSVETGEVLWEFNTAKTFETVNGVEAKGGSMGAAGPVVAGKQLFVPSGYIGVKRGEGGNVLLMFEPQ